MRLVACPNCHAQYDVAEVHDPSVRCRCGQDVAIRPLTGVEAKVHRCASCGASVGAEAKNCEYCRSAIVRDTARLSMICPECCARNAETSRFCTACGVGFRPEPLHVDGPELPCVDCDVAMPPRSVGGVVTNECPRCNGLWVPDDHFDDIVRRAVAAHRKSHRDGLCPAAPRVSSGNPLTDQVRYRRCPVCGSLMHRSNYRKTSGVIVDRCNEHGTWLDADELERIAGFIATGGIERSRAAAETTMRVPRAHSDSSARAETDFQRILVEHHPTGRRDRLWRSIGSLLNDLLS